MDRQYNLIRSYKLDCDLQQYSVHSSHKHFHMDFYIFDWYKIYPMDIPN